MRMPGVVVDPGEAVERGLGSYCTWGLQRLAEGLVEAWTSCLYVGMEVGRCGLTKKYAFTFISDEFSYLFFNYF
jgi:hypothetical protein